MYISKRRWRLIGKKRDYRRNLLMRILLNVQYMYMKPNLVRLNLIITGYSFNYSITITNVLL